MQRDRAWEIHPYPCIGQFRFLDFPITYSNLYSSILDRLRSGHTFLDLGCCFGQDIRKLVYDGAPPERLQATDLHPEFLDLGYDLFRDRTALQSTFFAADILGNDETSAFQAREESIDILQVSSFFHLFPLCAQLSIAKRLLRLLRPVSGSLILGRQTGNINPGIYQHGSTDETTDMYRHDAHTWTEMWRQIGAQVGVRLNVEAKLEYAKGFAKREGEHDERMMRWRNDGDRRLIFAIWRV